MFFIPGFLIAALTFPGVIVHEAAHMFFCRWRKVPVFDFCFFRLGNPAGYVVHGPADSFLSTFLISMGPFFINTLLCFLICFPAYLPVHEFHLSHPLSYFLLWLGVSIGMHAIPSTTDAANIWEAAKVAVKKFDPLAIISFPLVVLIFVFNALTVVWADVLYGIAIGVWLPGLIY